MTLIKTVATAFAVASLASVAAAQSLETPNKCAFYEHWDYQGESFMLHNGHVLTTDPNFKVGPDFTNGKDYQRFDAPQWANKISSNKVAPGCKAIVVVSWSQNVWVGDVPQYDQNYNDKVVAVGCRCQ